MNRETSVKLLVTTAVIVGLSAPASAQNADVQRRNQQQQAGQQLSGQQDELQRADARTRMQQGTTEVGTQTALTAEQSQEIASNLSDVLKSALDNDLESVVDQFAETDRERLGEETNSAILDNEEPLEMFKEKWDAQYANQEIEHQRIPYAATATSVDNARVVVPAAEGKQVVLNLEKAGALVTRWRIDVDNSLTAAQLRANLAEALTQLSQKNDWPASPQEGANIVAARIFSAISGS